jgi:hypothetical protein
MAANDYYQTNKPLPPVGANSPYGAYNTPQTSHSTPAPAYSATTQPPPSQHLTTSPFETPFDDHVHPLDSRQSSNTSVPQPGRYNQDTSYYPPGRASPEEHRYNNEDIPLQDRPPVKDQDLHDHVYDAGESGRTPRNRKKKRGGVRLGEIGMFTNGKKRIPWVVYVFSVVQIAVFIGEIIRNGKQGDCPAVGLAQGLTP